MTTVTMLLAACSDSPVPDNFEPVIELLPAQDITRTEAVVSARVHKRGTENLTYAIFRYGETGNTDRHMQANDSGADVLTVSLSGLKPGTSYSCYLEAGTATASLRTETISFTTQPNELPSVSAPVPLSTGPLGIIVEFDITDDGGEPVLQAGCDVKDIVTGETSRTCLPSSDLGTGPHRLRLGGLKPITSYSITPFASNTIGETKGQALEYTTSNSIVLKEAGTLDDVFEGSMKVDIRHLTISGPMDGGDFRFLRGLVGAPGDYRQIESSVCELDLTDVHIVSGGGAYDGSRFTEADKVSTGLFADCAALRAILLPSTATTLARDAFARCGALESLAIAAAITSVLPSEGCTSLGSIDVSAANISFASVDGVLFDHDVTGLLWFPLGKTGPYTLPPTVTSIGENAFYGTHITSLEIPPSVTSIGRGAFAGSELREISLPDNIANISESMFQGCSALATVRLGTDIRYVGDYAFDGTVLTDLYVGATVPPFAAGQAFVNGGTTVCGGCTLHVPAGCKTVYRRHRMWGLFGTIEEY